MDVLKFSKVRDVKSPARSHESAGIDFYIPNDWNEGKPLFLHQHQDALIPSGIKVNVPKGFALVAFNKSGVATKLRLVAGACVVDFGYEGEIHLHLINTSSYTVALEPGMKILQFVLLPIGMHTPTEVQLDELYPQKSSRGEGGFGSTGHK
jgi:dUTP pyrophosphatase